MVKIDIKRSLFGTFLILVILLNENLISARKKLEYNIVLQKEPSDNSNQENNSANDSLILTKPSTSGFQQLNTEDVPAEHDQLSLSSSSYMTNGGVQGPLKGYNSLLEDSEELTTPTTTTQASYMHPKWAEPYFDSMTPKNVTALVGRPAYLNCRVRQLGNKTVSWIRHRDIHILTVGSYTYTSDQRFQATYHKETEDWTLQIKWAQKRDAGMYECQISTQPVRSYFIRLNVVVPTATILGSPDIHVDKGSTINLTCTVKYSPEPPAYIFWYHHEEVINYDSSRGGVSVITEKGDITTSFLLIQNADLADSGKYSCAPSNADVASVRVHVLTVRAVISGEHPEAMQTGSSGCRYSWFNIILLLIGLNYFNYRSLSNLTNFMSFTNNYKCR